MTIYTDYLKKWKIGILEYYKNLSPKIKSFEKSNRYFYQYRLKILQSLIPENSQVLELGCGTGFHLSGLKPEKGKGLDLCSDLIEMARKDYPGLEFEVQDIDELKHGTNMNWQYIFGINLLLEVPDIFKTLLTIRSCMDENTRLIFINHHSLWEYAIKIYTFFLQRKRRIQQNWLHERDYLHFFSNSGLRIIRHSRELFFPFNIPCFSDFLNRFLSFIPIIRNFAILDIYVLSRTQTPSDTKELSCSVIVPCKNEEENIPLIPPRIPSLGSRTELIFINDRSTDSTLEKMCEAQTLYPLLNIQIVEGEGKGKGAACRKGFEAASGDVCVILDADLTVVPEVLPDFLTLLKEGRAEFVNGSRMIYPLEKDSMRFANRLGNLFFASVFSWITGIKINDTLCGTKMFYKSDLNKILETRKWLGEKDIWGDFDLIFTAVRYHLIYAELPVHYFPRDFGDTKMTKRLRNACIMFFHCWNAFKAFRLL